MPLIKGKQIADSAITEAKIGSGAVTVGKIGTGAIVEGKIGTGAVTVDKIGTGAVTEGKIGTGAVTETKIGALAVSDGKLAGDISDAKLATPYLKADGTRALTGDLSAGTKKITNLGTPSATADAATKGYVDGVVQGLDIKPSSKAATTAVLPDCTYSGAGNGTLTADANGAFPTVDGVAPALNQKYLVKNQATGLQNGLYSLTTVGDAGTPWVLTRVDELKHGASAAGAFSFVEEGTTNGDAGFVCTTGDVVGTDALTFTQFSGAGQIEAGAGLTKTGNTLNVGAGNGIAVGADSVAVDLAAANPGLEISESKLRVSAHGNGLTGGAGSLLAVLAENTSVVVGVGGVKAARPTKANKAAASAVTSGNYQDTGVDIAATPAGDGYVRVLVNGLAYELGDGVRTKDCYFSADGGNTARAIDDIAAADSLYWNGVIAGFDLAITDIIDLDYCTT
jgi:hypothetical protein